MVHLRQSFTFLFTLLFISYAPLTGATEELTPETFKAFVDSGMYQYSSYYDTIIVGRGGALPFDESHCIIGRLLRVRYSMLDKMNGDLIFDTGYCCTTSTQYKRDSCC